jgi:glycosyltransferase involved in cell wall biosynthesis
MISFIIPAHDEERLIGRTLMAVRAAVQPIGEPYEVIVVDDASTDRTATIAAEQGGRVISVSHRQIGATRNSGARAAQGEVLFFVDADTIPTAEAVRAGLAALRAGAVGGGCVFRFDCPLPFWVKIMLPIGIIACRLLKIVGGCFLFCTRSAFEAIGGFDEHYFAGEEIDLVRRLKRQGRFVVPWEYVITSGRKLSQVTAWTAIRLLSRFVVSGFRPFCSREGLEIWYGERRP